MKYNHVGGCRNVSEYTIKKINELNSAANRDFGTLFEFMFSERDAILYERSVGYKIVKTSYEDARRHSLEKGAALHRRLAGQPHDAIVAIHMQNSAEWIETFWGVLVAGYCPFLLNLRLGKETLEQALSDSGAVAVISDGEIFSLPTFMYSELENTGDTPCTGPFGSRIWVMSTGTSSRVKICAYGGEEFCDQICDSAFVTLECAQIKRRWDGDLKVLAFLPFYHVFGLVAMYSWFAFVASTFVHLNDMEPQTLLNTVRRHEVTHMLAVPLFWERIYERAERGIAERGEATLAKYRKGVAIARKLDGIPALAKAFRRKAFAEIREQIFGETVQYMITGGSPIRPEALAFFNDIGYYLVNGYGMTEIGITSVEMTGDARLRNTGSVGKPLPSVTYRIADNGELLVRGKATASEIRQGDKRTYRSDEWFHTGDLAECRNGSYYILGRVDDLILLPNGEMLNPNLIEPRFLLPDALEACLVDTGKDGKARPTLLIATERGLTKERMDALAAAVDEKLKADKLDTSINGVVFVEGTLLAENDFKLNRTTIARRYLNGEFSGAAPQCAPESTATTELEVQVAEVFATALNVDATRIGTHADFFRDLGGTSLDYFAMMSALKETFELPFEETEDTDFHTVSGVCRYIEDTERHVS